MTTKRINVKLKDRADVDGQAQLILHFTVFPGKK